METVAPLIKISGLTHCFSDGTEALKGIDLEIDAGSFTVIGGENGSGKTVLMKHINGILKPTHGNVEINGIDVQKDSTNAIKTVGFVFQNSDTQIVAQTVRDDIAFGPENLGFDADAVNTAVEKAASSLGITGILEHSPHRLSGGEKKKTAIAGITAMSPEAVIFDEPFAGLDFAGVRMLLSILIELHRRGTAVIVITHDLEKVLAHADRLVVMKHGKITAEGIPGEVLDKAAEAGLRVPSINIKNMSWLA